ncbi:MAG: DUF134 domain-containing protein [Dehalococcoidales bacterium]|nr:DUF134 domain-containing protein [Dehalococcoidales bacterium]
MGRQTLWRRVGFLPQITYFKPTGVPLTNLEEERISVEEAEAIRLKDLEDLELEDCARRMNISRTTFSRILNSARKKIADALLSGKAIRIEGGNFKMAVRRFRCINGHEWDVSFEAMIKEPPRFCLTCSTQRIVPLWPYGLRWGKSVKIRHSRLRQKE